MDSHQALGIIAIVASKSKDLNPNDFPGMSDEITLAMAKPQEALKSALETAFQIDWDIQPLWPFLIANAKEHCRKLKLKSSVRQMKLDIEWALKVMNNQEITDLPQTTIDKASLILQRMCEVAMGEFPVMKDEQCGSP
jgi:hypothetical protein